MGSAAVLLLGIVLGPGVRSVSLPEITNGSFVEECVREHNKARSTVRPSASDMLHMTWDKALAITARAWARHCVSEHNVYLTDARRVHPTFPSVGENLWWGSPSLFSVGRAVKGWVDEKDFYSYGSNACDPSAPYGCAHYTQVVWGGSYKVGCAAQLCPNILRNSEGVLFVCNYGPAGNMNGRRPYESGGAACSGCSGTCVDSLCQDQQRDSQMSAGDSWAPDWDPVVAAPASNYWSILVVRPIALTFTFITAYAVRFFYPDVFCYE